MKIEHCNNCGYEETAQDNVWWTCCPECGGTSLKSLNK